MSDEYTLVLRCHDPKHVGPSVQAEFAGTSMDNCNWHGYHAGWRLYRGKVLCPACATRCLSTLKQRRSARMVAIGDECE